MTNELELQLGYTDSSYTNKLVIGEVADSIASDSSAIKQKINEINASLSASTDGGLADFIVANDFDGTGGKLRKITGAVITNIEEIIVYPAQ